MVKKTLLQYAGAWKGDKEELDAIEKQLIKERHKAKLRDVKFD